MFFFNSIDSIISLFRKMIGRAEKVVDKSFVARDAQGEIINKARGKVVELDGEIVRGKLLVKNIKSLIGEGDE